MSFDMSQFYQVFFEEAGEHLDNMESLLVELDLDNPDSEQLNAIFRAAHSIKGSAGTFGFNDMTEVTHILENLLDRIRKGELAIRGDMVDAFLVARDVLGGMLATHRDGVAGDPAAATDICARLKLLTEDSVPVAAGPAVTATTPVRVAAASGLNVRFVLAGKLSEWAPIVENLLHELGEGCELVQRGTDEQTTWCLRVPATVDVDDLRGQLDFIACSDSVRIEPFGMEEAKDEESAYGFFADEVTPDTVPPIALVQDESYGFFDEPEAAVVTPTVSDDSFGFFEPLPAVVAEAPESVASASIVSVIASPSVKAAATAVAPGKAANAGDTTIRVGIDKVDQIINLVGELVITQAMLVQSAENLDPVTFERLNNGLAQLERNTRDLQESVMSIRMMPISTVFNRFPRVVRDLSSKLGKQVELRMMGESTELDRGLIERITDPLTHLVRNSLDHGIESPEKRLAAGKSAGGVITLKAYQQSGNVVIEVGDDGAGLNRDKILSKAQERGLAVSESMSDGEVWNLIFEAGFSTADQITDVSGRGVGMDVVKRNIAAMGGRVDIESMGGVGTRMTVRLPLTLAILDGMSIAAGDETYIIPLGYVIESLQPTASMLKSMGGVARLIQVRGEYLPIIPLYEAFDIPGCVSDYERGIMVLLEADGHRAALFVDALVGQHQVVIKSLEANYRKVVGVSGATIMGDGRVAFILDVVALVTNARTSMSAAA